MNNTPPYDFTAPINIRTADAPELSRYVISTLLKIMPRVERAVDQQYLSMVRQLKTIDAFELSRSLAFISNIVLVRQLCDVNPDEAVRIATDGTGIMDVHSVPGYHTIFRVSVMDSITLDQLFWPGVSDAQLACLVRHTMLYHLPAKARRLIRDAYG